MGTSAARLTTTIPRRLGIDRARVLLAAVLATILGGTMLFGVAVATFALPFTDSMAKHANDLAAIANGGADNDTRSKIYSADGHLLAVLHGEQNREPVSFSQIPDTMKKAVVAIEDHRFYQHDGVDMTALGRALIVNVSGGSVEQGGGTITMQLARNAYLHNRSRTIARKWDEIVMARQLEHRFTKNEILTQYLNTVYFGRGAYGIQAAAEAFFGESAMKLTLAQSAFLAGLIRAPQTLDPNIHRADALARRTQVLTAMRDQHMIDDREFAAASHEKLRLAAITVSNGIDMVADAGASFVEYIKQQLLADTRLGDTPAARAAKVFGGGLRVTTTLDLRAQRAAERSIASVLNLKGDPSGALASVEPTTGAIRAMAGAITAQGFNLAAQGRRQPGSAFKPFTLVAAIEKGFSLYRRYSAAVPRIIHLPDGEDWVVHNYEGAPGGTMSIVDATKFSVNTVYAQIVMQVGASKVVDAAHRMGITSPLEPFPSIALGALTIGVSPLEMASAYATLANGGTSYRPYAITKVTDRNGRVYWTGSSVGTRALDPDVANKARAVLQQVIASGTGKRAQRLGRPEGGKTGTTNDYRDSWFAGFTPQLSTVVWIGYPDRLRPMLNIHGLPKMFGGSLPCEIWTRFMISALAGKPVLDFPAVSLGGGSFGSSSGSFTSQPGLQPPAPAPPTRRCWGGHHQHCR